MQLSGQNVAKMPGTYGSFTLADSDSETDTDSMKFYCHRVSVTVDTFLYKPFTSRSLCRTRSLKHAIRKAAVCQIVRAFPLWRHS